MNSDFVPPPPHPPPPKLPEGWTARWDPNYRAFYYVNLLTKQSQWELPTAPATPGPPVSPPPSYGGGEGDPSRGRPGLERPFSAPVGGYSTPPGAQPGYMPQPPPQPQQEPPRSRSQGIASKLSSFLKGGSSSQPQRPAYGTPPPSNYYGGMPPQPGYYPPQQPQYYPQQPPNNGMYGGPQRKRGMGGMGMLGGAGLGLGAGMLGGMLLGEAISDHDQHEYMEGYQDAQDQDFGGGDFDGGDFGGDF
jgi:hypothetical protein